MSASGCELGGPHGAVLANVQEVGRGKEISLTQGFRAMALGARKCSRHCLYSRIEQQGLLMGTDKHGPGRGLSAHPLCQQLSESCCHREFALVHVIGTLAMFPPEVRSLSVSYPLSSS